MHKLSIGDNKGSHHGEPTSQNRQLLAEARSLARKATLLSKRAESVRALIETTDTSEVSSLDEIHSLKEAKVELGKASFEISNAWSDLEAFIEDSVLKELKSLAHEKLSSNPEGWSVALHYFSSFEVKISHIVRQALQYAAKEELMWRITEECCNQAVRPRGTLAIDTRVRSRDDNSSDRKDNDKESPSGQNVEIFLVEDPRHDPNIKDKSANQRHGHDDHVVWVRLWREMLNSVSNGPTLFCLPVETAGVLEHSEQVPHYLFRVFDDDSSGLNNDYTIASIASEDRQRGNRRDVLTMKGRSKAAQLLYNHMKKALNSGRLDDNFVSWTSSLLFAIQYAVYRRWRQNNDEAVVKLCIIDTRKYPRGQFMEDLSLLRKFDGAAKEIGGEVENFFDFRLSREDYQNGEYLSQGAVHHHNRSCIVTLNTLVEAGLYTLCPEFKYSNHKWTERVRDLRQEWSEEVTTSIEDIQCALDLAKACSATDDLDLATAFLTLKNRTLRGNRWRNLEKHRAEHALKPVEVERWWVASQSAQAKVSRQPDRQDLETLRSVFL